MFTMQKYVALSSGDYIDVNIDFNYYPSDVGDRDTPPSGSSVEIDSVTAVHEDDPLFEFPNIHHLISEKENLEEACVMFAEEVRVFPVVASHLK